MPNPEVSVPQHSTPPSGSMMKTSGTHGLGAHGDDPTILESNGPVGQAVADGTSGWALLSITSPEMGEQGSPIDLVYPSDGAPYVSQPAGIFQLPKILKPQMPSSITSFQKQAKPLRLSNRTCLCGLTLAYQKVLQPWTNWNSLTPTWITSLISSPNP